jgi:hypothetical protein
MSYVIHALSQIRIYIKSFSLMVHCPTPIPPDSEPLLVPRLLQDPKLDRTEAGGEAAAAGAGAGGAAGGAGAGGAAGAAAAGA